MNCSLTAIDLLPYRHDAGALLTTIPDPSVVVLPHRRNLLIELIMQLQSEIVDLLDLSIDESHEIGFGGARWPQRMI